MSITRRTFIKSIVFGATGLTFSGCSTPVEVSKKPAKTNNKPAGTDNEKSNATGEDQLTVTFLKVGKADAAVLVTPAATVMIDTGDADSSIDVVEGLEDLGIKRIDTLIVTHYDQDHVGGAAAVISEFDVGEVLCTYRSKESLEVDAYDAAMDSAGLTEKTITADMGLTAGPMNIEVLAPKQDEYDKDTSNNSSLVCLVTFGTNRLLFAGDIQEERIDELIAAKYDLTCNLLKVPHHGACEDNTDKLIEATKPAYAVICCSKKNPEDEDVVDMLEDAGAEVFVTRKGPITATLTPTSIAVDQE